MEKRILQDLKIITDNVEFSLPVYYSPSLKKTFIATLPEGYVGEFGPGIRALIISLYRDSKMTEPAIARFLKTFGVSIANSTISRMMFFIKKKKTLLMLDYSQPRISILMTPPPKLPERAIILIFCATLITPLFLHFQGKTG